MNVHKVTYPLTLLLNYSKGFSIGVYKPLIIATILEPETYSVVCCVLVVIVC